MRHSRTTLSLLAIGALLLCGAPRLARAQSSDARAKQHLAEGERLFEHGEYAKAIQELTAGNVLNPQARIYYALGQAYRLNHQCTQAVKAYRLFLDSAPAESQARATEKWIERCGEEDPGSTVAPPVTPPPVAPVIVNAPQQPVAVVPVEPPPPPPPKQPVYKKWWLWTTVGVVAAVGLGVGLGVGLTEHASSFPTTLQTFGPGTSTAMLARVRFP